MIIALSWRRRRPSRTSSRLDFWLMSLAKCRSLPGRRGESGILLNPSRWLSPPKPCDSFSIDQAAATSGFDCLVNESPTKSHLDSAVDRLRGGNDRDTLKLLDCARFKLFLVELQRGGQMSSSSKSLGNRQMDSARIHVTEFKQIERCRMAQNALAIREQDRLHIRIELSWRHQWHPVDASCVMLQQVTSCHRGHLSWIHAQFSRVFGRHKAILDLCVLQKSVCGLTRHMREL